MSILQRGAEVSRSFFAAFDSISAAPRYIAAAGRQRWRVAVRRQM